jgi:hypothetical protein
MITRCVTSYFKRWNNNNTRIYVSNSFNDIYTDDSGQETVKRQEKQDYWRGLSFGKAKINSWKETEEVGGQSWYFKYVTISVRSI